MKNRIAILLALLAGLLLGQLPLSLPDVFAAPPGSQTTYDDLSPAQATYLLRHELVAKGFASRALEVSNLTSRAAVETVKRDALGDKVRAALIERWPTLESKLPTLTNIAFGYTDSNGNKRRDPGEDSIKKLWLNGAATAARSAPPAGLVVGP